MVAENFWAETPNKRSKNDKVLNELKKRKGKYGMVTMCVGSGQGAAGIFEMLD